MFKYFDKIFVINLDKNKEKWNSVIAELKKHNINNYTRFSGIFINNGESRLDRVNGCKESHIQIVEFAKKNKLKNVLIFEDDIIIDNSLTKYIDNIIKFIDKTTWDLCYFGGNHVVKDLIYNVPEKISENVVKINHTLTTHSYAINYTCYDKIIKFRSSNFPIDTELTTIQKEGNSYCISPRIIYQKEGFSEILLKNKNYDSVLKGD